MEFDTKVMEELDQRWGIKYSLRPISEDARISWNWENLYDFVSFPFLRLQDKRYLATKFHNSLVKSHSFLRAPDNVSKHIWSSKDFFFVFVPINRSSLHVVQVSLQKWSHQRMDIASSKLFKNELFGKRSFSFKKGKPLHFKLFMV